MTIRANFGVALKKLRLSKRLSQEDFALVSSRTYISSLERGLKNPTLEKIESIAKILGVSPITLITLAYDNDGDVNKAVKHLKRVEQELVSLNKQ